MSILKKAIALFFIALLLSSQAFSQSSANQWSTYLDETSKDHTPSKLLVYALLLFKQEGKTTGAAADLGAGSGKDTLYLLQNHWQVLAIDYAPKSIAMIKSRARAQHLPMPQTQISDFKTMQLPSQLDLINANLALPFVSPNAFPAVWQNIVNHLRIGGRFSGNFFGAIDGYANDKAMTFLTLPQLKLLFKDFKIEKFHERHGNYLQANGQIKYWQIWDIVAKKVRNS